MVAVASDRARLDPTSHPGPVSYEDGGRYDFNWGGEGGGVGRGILKSFCEKSRGPPTSQIGLMHGLHISSNTKMTGSENN